VVVEALTALEAPTGDLSPLALHRQVSELRAEHAAAKQKLEGRRLADESVDAATKARDELVARLETAVADRLAAATRAAEIDARLPDLRAAAVDPDVLRAEIDTAERLVEDRTDLDALEVESVPLSEQRAAAAQKHRNLLRAFTETQAPRLAKTLEDGEPCPVCGSTDHPGPATAGDLRVVDWDEVAEAAGHHDQADEKLRKLESRITELRARLGDDVATEAGALRQRVDAKKAELDRATAAAATIGALENERNKLSTDLDRLTTDTGRFEASRDQAVETLAQAVDAARSAAEEAAGLDVEDLDRRAVHLERLDAALDGYDGLIDAVASAATLLEARRADLSKHLGDSEHADATAARAVLWTPEQEQAAQVAARKHQTAHDTAAGALKALLDEGVPPDRPDVDAAEAALAAADSGKNRLESLAATVDVNVRGLTAALERCDRLDAGSAELRTRAEVAARAHQVCAKGGPVVPVALKRWVLAHELDRITAAANVHLAAMTNGRYALHRLEDQHDGRRAFGLDLEVDDINTGRPRSTRSLSGGEQFQASLALALGLADVISHGGTAGGQTFEALFVDEGFGSLSPRALDDAVETLTGLQHSGRMVGAITHVEAMKDVLHVGIEVTRRDDGRGSTLTVAY
jgi:exonuclease SbcC